MSKKLNVIVHTDGACKGNPGPGGWGAVLQFGEHTKELSGASEGETTNNRMELQAVVEALSALKSPCNVVIKSDSRYVVSSMMIYMHDWKKRGWKKSNGEPVAHEDLWRQINDLMKVHKVFPYWIPREQNAHADILASAAVA
jgi:ribonuclease HI